MDPVNGLNQIVQILRQKLSEGSSSHSKKSIGTSSGTSGIALRTDAKLSVEEIKHKIGDRIKSLSDEEMQGTKGAQIFVELIITWEFGDRLLQDSQFTQLSKDVVNTITENPTAWKHLQTLLHELTQV